MKHALKWILAGFLVFTSIIVAATGCASVEEAGTEVHIESTATSDDFGADVPEAEEEPAPEEHASGETAGQENARRSAVSYLEFGAFSRKGLIRQLKYEGYSTADATYAVDAVGPDWNAQAVKAAESYLENSAFSRSGLVQQLKYEGYTDQQAEYGVGETGLGAGNAEEPDAPKADASGETAGQENARRSAESYLEFGAFSRTGIIRQL